ncbi:MAG: CarD family transcriptional regulator, partial [Rhodospirillales bacterium]|nr:CarD family transcriptional regulator [Rhodospirillales bacterium]
MPKAPTYKTGDFVVYPTHGVGKVIDVLVQEIASHKLELIVITFERDRMTLRVPVEMAATSGRRMWASKKILEVAMTTLRGGARVKRTM